MREIRPCLRKAFKKRFSCLPVRGEIHANRASGTSKSEESAGKCPQTISSDETRCNRNVEVVKALRRVVVPNKVHQTANAHIDSKSAGKIKRNRHNTGNRNDEGKNGGGTLAHKAGGHIASEVHCKGSEEEGKHHSSTVTGHSTKAFSTKNSHGTVDFSVRGRVCAILITNVEGIVEDKEGSRGEKATNEGSEDLSHEHSARAATGEKTSLIILHQSSGLRSTRKKNTTSRKTGDDASARVNLSRPDCKNEDTELTEGRRHIPISETANVGVSRGKEGNKKIGNEEDEPVGAREDNRHHSSTEDDKEDVAGKGSPPRDRVGHKYTVAKAGLALFLLSLKLFLDFNFTSVVLVVLV
mmetsp:Transcript_5076/g.10556  ORF Transcript_5076/g.10556 Transcript_5076/m.10556 type:complete len:355 (+) Transcript_5076:157-1221(+)